MFLQKFVNSKFESKLRFAKFWQFRKFWKFRKKSKSKFWEKFESNGCLKCRIIVKPILSIFAIDLNFNRNITMCNIRNISQNPFKNYGAHQSQILILKLLQKCLAFFRISNGENYAAKNLTNTINRWHYFSESI